VNAATLNVISGSSAQINGDGVISNSISIGGANDILQISQTTGDLTGLTFNGNSLSIGTGAQMELSFDSAPSAGLDWAFRWKNQTGSNRIATLQNLISTGKIELLGDPSVTSRVSVFDG
jgi:hypothetical protein